MKYFVDTDWVADWLKGRPRAVHLLRALASDGFAISLVTYGEIYDGIYYGTSATTDEAAFEQFLREIDVLPLDEPIMRRFARIRGALRKQGQSIGDPDIMIAATVLHHDLTLVTRNLDHFRRVPDLRLYQLPRSDNHFQLTALPCTGAILKVDPVARVPLGGHFPDDRRFVLARPRPLRAQPDGVASRRRGADRALYVALRARAGCA